MPLEGNLEYALARVQAHHGARPREAEWRRVEASRDLPHFLDALRLSSLAAWTATLDPTITDGHGIERTLRSEWRRYVGQLSSWHPRPWQPWLGWFAWLPVLPLLVVLARPEPAPAWLLADPLLGPLALGSPEQRSTALRSTALASLATALLARQPLGVAWRARWQQLMPSTDADTRANVATLAALFDRFANALAVVDDSTGPREAFSAELGRLFRATGGTAVASVCHLALLAFDLERLRGGLISRSLFRPRGVESRSGRAA